MLPDSELEVRLFADDQSFEAFKHFSFVAFIEDFWVGVHVLDKLQIRVIAKLMILYWWLWVALESVKHELTCTIEYLFELLFKLVSNKHLFVASTQPLHLCLKVLVKTCEPHQNLHMIVTPQRLLHVNDILGSYPDILESIKHHLALHSYHIVLARLLNFDQRTISRKYLLYDLLHTVLHRFNRLLFLNLLFFAQALGYNRLSFVLIAVHVAVQVELHAIAKLLVLILFLD